MQIVISAVLGAAFAGLGVLVSILIGRLAAPLNSRRFTGICTIVAIVIGLAVSRLVVIPWLDAREIDAALVESPVMAAIKQYHPQEYRRIVSEGAVAATDQDIEKVQARIAAITRQSMTRANEDNTLTKLRLTQAYAEAFSRRSEEECGRFLIGAQMKSDPREVLGALADREVTLNAEVIRQAAIAPHSWPPAQFDRLRDLNVTALAKLPPETQAVYRRAEPKVPTAEYFVAVCRQNLALNAQLLQLSPPEAARAYQGLLASDR